MRFKEFQKPKNIDLREDRDENVRASAGGLKGGGMCRTRMDRMPKKKKKEVRPPLKLLFMPDI